MLVDETGSRLGSIDFESGLFIDSGYDLTKYRKGWHHVTVIFEGGMVTYYIDAKATREAQSLVYNLPIGFLGNSGTGREPFGTMSDLRIFEGALTQLQIANLAKYHDELGKLSIPLMIVEFEMADKYHTLFMEEGFI